MTEKNFVFDSTVSNDSIDIYGELDVAIKKMPSNANEMKLLLEGQSIDFSVVNAIRRTILLSIPVYAFHRSNIHVEIEKSRHMYNNDLIYNQIETLPIYDIPNYFDLENPEVFLPNKVMKALFGKFIQETYSEEVEDQTIIDANKKMFKIELSINFKNTTATDKFVSTHEAVLKIDGKVSNSYQTRRPISILVLKPNEEISLRAEANLGISKIYGIYEATSNAVYKEFSPTKYELSYETLEQLDKNVIFTKACVIMFKKLEYLSTYIKEKYDKDDNILATVEIQLFGEDHTLGNLLATTLQKCKDINKAGYVMPHPFIDQITVSFVVNPKSKSKPIKILLDVIDYLIRLFQTIANTAFKKT